MLIDAKQFMSALEAAWPMTDEQLRAAARSGTSRSYYVVFRGRTFPLKAVLRLAYIREELTWDGPQSSVAAKALKADFTILHITQDTETKRLERQRLNAERWSRDGQFRPNVLDLYGSTCVVSGCFVLDAIDAAHLLGVGKDGDDKPENGIVFRADLHRLYDAQRARMSINPDGMTVHFSGASLEHYAAYEGKKIELPEGGPKSEAFVAHWLKFLEDKDADTDE